MEFKLDLNNSEQTKAADPGKMLEALWKLPDQCTEALKIAQEAELPAQLSGINNIVISGLGGSAIGGDLLRVFVAGKAPVPVIVVRDYTLPKFVSSSTLLFAVSYSGNTEETISAYGEAKTKGANIIAVTTGGKLKAMAQQDGIPVITIPSGISPRAATGYLFIPTLVALQRLGIIDDVTPEIEETIKHLTEQRELLKVDSPKEDNVAKQLAEILYNKIPVIWGSSGTTEVVATRWKGQINENSKAPAYWNTFPELNHNELVGFETPPELLKELEVIVLRDSADHPRVQKRFDITKTIMGDAVAGVTELYATGSSSLARTFSLIYVGDHTSVYLAALYGIDPTPVKVIDFLKNKLAEE